MDVFSDKPCFYFRVIVDEQSSMINKGKYHFDVMLPHGFLCTNGAFFDSFESCADALADFSKLMFNHKGNVPYVLSSEDLQLNQKRSKV